jgi:hypothetical protein
VIIIKTSVVLGSIVMSEETRKTQPIKNPKLINIAETAPGVALSFTEEQYQKLQEGLVPKAMEDKWYIYFENDCLYFHRSWTGFGVLRAEINKEDGEGEGMKYSIKEFYAEREGIKNGDDVFDLDVLTQLIYWGLLGIDTRDDFIQKHGTGEKGTMLTWSIFGRMFFPE